MNPRISMITLGVADLQTAIHFYEKGLGFPRMKSPPEVAFFTLNGTWLGLYGKESLAQDAGLVADGSGFCGFTLAHNVHTQQEVKQVFRKAIAAGAKKVKKPHAVFWGGYVAYFKDPDGYVWEIAHNPAFWPGPEDNA